MIFDYMFVTEFLTIVGYEPKSLGMRLEYRGMDYAKVRSWYVIQAGTYGEHCIGVVHTDAWFKTRAPMGRAPMGRDYNAHLGAVRG